MLLQVSGIITDGSAASEFITCCAAICGANITRVLQMFILYEDVDDGADTGRGTLKLETRLSISEKSITLLPNLQAGSIYTFGTRLSET